jgi:hypothetical protein
MRKVSRTVSDDYSFMAYVQLLQKQHPIFCRAKVADGGHDLAAQSELQASEFKMS